MVAESEVSIETIRRRRRQAAIVAGLISALFASALFGDWFFNRDPKQETVWTSDTVFPRFAEDILRRHGVTVPIGRPAIIRDRQYKGEGGPEDPGPFINENHVLLAGRYDPINIDGLSLPGRRFNRIGHYAPHDGSSFGGGPGGGVIVCETLARAAKLAEIEKVCPGTPTKNDRPGSVASDPTVSTGDGPEPNGLAMGGGPMQTGPTLPGTLSIGGSDAPQTPTEVAISPVPEPEGWMMMIAGFLLTGIAIRRRGAQAVARHQLA